MEHREHRELKNASRDSLVVSLYTSGSTYSEIVEIVSVSTKTVRKILKQNNIPIRKSGCRALEIDLEAIAKGYENGKSLLYLSKVLGVSHDTVYRRLKEAGYPIKRTVEKELSNVCRDELAS